MVDHGPALHPSRQRPAFGRDRVRGLNRRVSRLVGGPAQRRRCRLLAGAVATLLCLSGCNSIQGIGLESVWLVTTGMSLARDTGALVMPAASDPPTRCRQPPPQRPRSSQEQFGLGTVSERNGCSGPQSRLSESARAAGWVAGISNRCHCTKRKLSIYCHKHPTRTLPKQRRNRTQTTRDRCYRYIDESCGIKY